MDSIRISNDHPIPMSKRVRAHTIEHGPFPAPASDRVVFVRPLRGEELLSNPRRVLQRMRVGDNAFFPVLPQDANSFRSRVLSAAKIQGVEIVSRADTYAGLYGLRIWRIS